jgi:hypothetical protein
MPILERDYDDGPLPRDVDESWVVSDADTDLGWAHDRRWTARRVLMVIFLVITLAAFLALTFSGIFQPTPQFDLPPTQVIPRV